jgi:hypothetical protein
MVGIAMRPTPDLDKVHGSRDRDHAVRYVNASDVTDPKRNDRYRDQLGPWFDELGEIIPVGTETVGMVIDQLCGTYTLASNRAELHGEQIVIDYPAITQLIQNEWDRITGPEPSGSFLLNFESMSPTLGRIAEELIVRTLITNLAKQAWAFDLVVSIDSLVEDQLLKHRPGPRCDDLALLSFGLPVQYRLIEVKATAKGWAQAGRMIQKALLQLEATACELAGRFGGSVIVAISLRDKTIGVLDLPEKFPSPEVSLELLASNISAWWKQPTVSDLAIPVKDQMTAQQASALPTLPSVGDLTPYLSMIIAKTSTTTSHLSPESIMDDLIVISGFKGVKSGQNSSNGVDFAFGVLQEFHRPSWLSSLASTSIRDILHHLVVVVKTDGLFAIFSSDSRLANKIARNLGNSKRQALQHCRTVAASQLNGALLTGASKTLWLSGIHAQTSSRPDRKILAGIDLRDALDPMSDQSFHFTAARGTTEIEGASTVGVSPSRSRVWVGPTGNWTDFLSTTA